MATDGAAGPASQIRKTEVSEPGVSGSPGPGAHAAPQVSVVCAWYNRADYLEEMLASLLAQDHPDFEIVLVDDGSPDPRVGEILARQQDPRLRIIRQANTGFVGAIRRAVAESRGPYIAMMGAGDICRPERLRLQAAALDAQPGHVGVGCSYSEPTIDPAGQVVDRRDHHRTVRDIDHAYIRHSRGGTFTHGEVMYRRAAYEAVGGYRPFFTFAQDLDLWLRMSRLGPFTLCPEMLYERRLFQADGVGADIRKYVIQRSLAYTAKLCADQRAEWGCDVVDVFGREAGLMLAPDRFRAGFFAKTAIKYLRGGMLPEARFFSALARSGQWTPVAAGTALLVRAHEGRALGPLAARLARAIPVQDQRQLLPIPALHRKETAPSAALPAGREGQPAA